ncbi:MAG: HAD family hydrolase [Lentisphaerae bacterium]|nr:HAD family hydrolase [Lentisphaerota bacterium]
MRGFDHVIWDWNGTLLDDAWLCVDVMNGMLCRRALPGLTPAKYEESFDFPVLDFYRRLGFDFEREAFGQVGLEFVEAYERRKGECRLRSGAASVLSEIRRSGIGQSVLSACRHERLVESIARLGLSENFSGVFGHVDDYASGKVEKGRQLARSMGCPMDRVLIVGDTVHDFDVARAMGAACLLMPCGHNSRQRLAACGAPVISSIEDVLGQLP